MRDLNLEHAVAVSLIADIRIVRLLRFELETFPFSLGGRLVFAWIYLNFLEELPESAEATRLL
jgi:hypothetical protein